MLTSSDLWAYSRMHPAADGGGWRLDNTAKLTNLCPPQLAGQVISDRCYG